MKIVVSDVIYIYNPVGVLVVNITHQWLKWILRQRLLQV